MSLAAVHDGPGRAAAQAGGMGRQTLRDWAHRFNRDVPDGLTNRKGVGMGHSAGGHLAACMIATDWEAIHPDLPHDLVASGMGISGIYNLLPLIWTPVNDAPRMDEAAALAASPMSWLPDAIQRFEA